MHPNSLRNLKQNNSSNWNNAPVAKVEEVRKPPVVQKTNVWNSVSVEEVRKRIENGEIVNHNPFQEGDVDFRAGDIVYEYTQAEIDEIKKCARDVVYFANKYAVSMTDAGIQKIKLRPYQEAALRHFQNNRWSVFLASRQVGKCGSYLTKIITKNRLSGKESKIFIGDLFYSTSSLSFLSFIKKSLYKFYDYLSRF